MISILNPVLSSLPKVLQEIPDVIINQKLLLNYPDYGSGSLQKAIDIINVKRVIDSLLQIAFFAHTFNEKYKNTCHEV